MTKSHEEVGRRLAQQLDAGKTMAEMWEGFAGMILQGVPRDCPQWRDMQGAFFAGGYSLFHWFMVQMDEDREVTDADLGKVSLMEAELAGFFNRERPQ